MLNEWPKLDEQKLSYFKRYNEPYFFLEKCCDFIKGNIKHDLCPSFIGIMIEESQLRKKSWIQHGCYIYGNKKIKSRPLSIWTLQDIWMYIKNQKLEVNPAYGYNSQLDINSQNLRFDRLGCTSCPYGTHIEQLRIQYFKKNHPEKLHSYKTLNLFKILFQEYPTLYKSQVINNGMYKVLIDMGITS